MCLPRKKQPPKLGSLVQFNPVKLVVVPLSPAVKDLARGDTWTPFEFGMIYRGQAVIGCGRLASDLA